MYRIVIVEDEAPIRRNLKNKIEECNLTFEVVEVFRNGEQIIKWLERNDVDVVFTDIKMPIMNGLELSKKIYETYRDIFVVIISGYNNFEYAREAIKYRVTDYLCKPVDLLELKSLLKELKDKIDKRDSTLSPSTQESVYSKSLGDLQETLVTYIKENFKDHITTDLLAEKFDCTEDNINRLLKKSIGSSLRKYIIQLRVSEAKKILRSCDDLDIQTVGDIVGYSDPYYFSRIFKKYTTLTPSAYRNKYKG